MSAKAQIVDLLTSIIKDHPNKDKMDTYPIFKEKMLENKMYLNDGIQFIFGMLYSTAYSAAFPATTAELIDRAKIRQVKLDEAEQEFERLKSTAKSIIARRLLDLITANGKPLRECTGAECKQLGGFYARVGEEVGASNIVGDNISEEEISQIAIEYNIQKTKTKTTAPDTVAAMI
jgi:hypothetical protein